MKLATRALLAVWLISIIQIAQAADHVVLIGGMGGEEKFTKEFSDSLLKIRDLLVKRHGYAAENIRLLMEKAKDADGVSTLETIKSEMTRLTQKAKSDDTLLLIMIGHGQSDFVEPKFNLPGPDLTADALAAMLDAVPAVDQRLILCFPCSGHFSELLGRPGRLIVASTDGPQQIYHSAAPQYLIDALSTDYGDLDGDEQLSFMELFEFLSKEVEEHYSSRGQLQTERPSLEDDGDGALTILLEGLAGKDGKLARELRIVPAPSLSETNEDVPRSERKQK